MKAPKPPSQGYSLRRAGLVPNIGTGTLGYCPGPRAIAVSHPHSVAAQPPPGPETLFPALSPVLARPGAVLQSKHFRNGCFDCISVCAGVWCRAGLPRLWLLACGTKRRCLTPKIVRPSLPPPAIGSPGSAGAAISKGLFIPEKMSVLLCLPLSLSFRCWVKPSSTSQQTHPEMGGPSQLGRAALAPGAPCHLVSQEGWWGTFGGICLVTW